MSRQYRPGNARLAHFWESLRTSLWFIPALMTAGAVGLSLVSVHFDRLEKIRWAGLVWAGSSEGARQVLSTIAGSMITVAGVAFSITIVALTLASTQFGPRLLRNFMRDVGNQVVLGTFVSTFVYCLLVLRTVRGGEGGGEFVPHLSVTIGVVLALTSLGVLIYFIHHVANMIQADSLIAAVFRELQATIDPMFPEELGEDEAPEDAPEAPAKIELEGVLVKSARSGYVQTVDDRELMAIASTEDLVLKLLRVPGRFVTEGEALVRAWPPDRLGDKTRSRIREAFILGRRRTPTQDPEYAVHQLVEIGVRALSPGINDPFTAMTCLDWLGAALSELARRQIPSRYRYDDRRRLRVIADVTNFPDMANAAFNQIRQYGRNSVSVLLYLLDTLAAVAEHVHRAEDRACLREHADKAMEDAREALVNPHDLREVEERYTVTVQTLLETAVDPEGG